MSDAVATADPPTEAEYAAAVGPRWETHYQRAFAAFDAGARGATFNRAAALVPFWLAARGLWLLQVVAIVAWIILLVGAMLFFDEYRGPMSDSVLPAILFACATLGIIEGWAGDRLVHRRARRRIARVRGTGVSHEAMLARLRRGAFQPLGAAAFVVVLMVAGAWALSVRLARTGGHTVPAVTIMKGVLRNLVLAEESYFADFSRYTAAPADSISGREGDTYRTGLSRYPVQVRIVTATADGWSAIALHGNSPVRCGIFVGSAPPPIPADSLPGPMSDGEPRCTTRGRR